MKKFLTSVLATALLACCFTGCGAPQKEGELNLVESGKLIMSTNAEFPPYEMTIDDGGFAGIDIEIAQAIAKELGLELVIDDMDFDAAMLAVQNGQSDICMAGLTVDNDRLKVMDFSTSYATGKQVIIVKDDSNVTVDNLGDQMIGTQKATTSHIYCTDDYGEDHVVAYDSSITAVQALLNGQVDCVVVDSGPAQELIKGKAGLKILETEYVTENYAIAVDKGNQALLDAINEVLAKLTADGTIQSIIDKYIKAE